MSVFTLLYLLIFPLVSSIIVNVQPGNFSQSMSLNVSSEIQQLLTFQPPDTGVSYKIEAWVNNEDNNKHPVLLVVEQESSVLSWSVPIFLKTTNKSASVSFLKTSRTLCDGTLLKNRTAKVKNFTVDLSTSSVLDKTVHLRIEKECDFFLKINQTYDITVSPSEPRYFFYNRTDSSTVIVDISSSDDVCFTASIQQGICPVFDLDKDITYSGIHQTIIKDGGMRIDMGNFPQGFFMVFVAKVDDYDCQTKLKPFSKSLLDTNRVTKVTFTLTPGRSRYEYIRSTWIVLLGIGIFCFVAVLIVGVFFCLRSTPQVDVPEDALPISVADFSNDLDIYHDHSQKYFWHTIHVALFYAIPVVQLMIAYQKITNKFGDVDVCYYNFGCANPLWILSDFNHVYSNIGYVITGILFLGMLVFRRKYMPGSEDLGIPVHLGVFYAMGIAIIAEGVLSACYHVCPNQENFQFGISFMYAIPVLCMIKLYQNRHPDKIPSAYSTFTVLASVIITSMAGLLNDTHRTLIANFVLICYPILCLYLSLKIYFFCSVLTGLRQIWLSFTANYSLITALKPEKTSLLIVVILANVINYVMLGVGIYFYKDDKINFGTLILKLLLINALLYSLFYMIMKLISGEKFCLQAFIYGVFSLGSWIASGLFFPTNDHMWIGSSAQSLHWNQECILLDFYDNHDLWHLFSAGALYFTFMFLLCLDDDLIYKRRNRIHVF